MSKKPKKAVEIPKGMDRPDLYKSHLLRRWALVAMDKHRQDGTLPTSIRHLFYEAVMAGVIPKHRESKGDGPGRRADQDLTEALTWLREQGYVPWEWIDDRTRHVMDFRGQGETIREGVLSVLDSIRIDPYENVLPIIVCESESVAGVLEGTANRYRSMIFPVRGQSQGWLRTAVPQAVGDMPVVVCYLGDWDRAGGDIETNTKKVLREVLDVKDWERVALTEDQVRAHGLPTDMRFDGRDKASTEACETEALPQAILLAEVEAWYERQVQVDLDDLNDQDEDGRDDVHNALV